MLLDGAFFAFADKINSRKQYFFLLKKKPQEML